MVHLFPSNLRFNACIPIQGITVWPNNFMAQYNFSRLMVKKDRGIFYLKKYVLAHNPNPQEYIKDRKLFISDKNKIQFKHLIMTFVK